jgi:mannose-6-phosphate isomerase
VIGYPLLLQPAYDAKIWGGRRLSEHLGKDLPAGAAIGESLESGNEAVVTNGPLAGRTVGELVRELGQPLLGGRGLAASGPFGDFPLLVKFIDASDVLSLQVHPDDEGAASLRKRGKTEAWYVVAAESHGELITGLTAALEPEAVREAIVGGGFEPLLERQAVRPGDTLLVPAGTLHAIGAGVLLYEVQQNSDITFRLYDWGRVDSAGRPRELHLDQALEVLRPDQRAGLIAPLTLGAGRTLLAACRYFALERWEVDGELPLSPNRETFRLLTGVEGTLTIEEPASTVVACGQTALLPADLPPARLTGQGVALVSSIPDLARDVLAPLRAAGYPEAEIARLDGGSGHLEQLLVVAPLAESSQSSSG